MFMVITKNQLDETNYRSIAKVVMKRKLKSRFKEYDKKISQVDLDFYTENNLLDDLEDELNYGRLNWTEIDGDKMVKKEEYIKWYAKTKVSYMSNERCKRLVKTYRSSY